MSFPLIQWRSFGA